MSNMKLKVMFFNDRKIAVDVGVNGFFDKTTIEPQESKVFEIEVPVGCIPFFKIWEYGSALLTVAADPATKKDDSPFLSPEHERKIKEAFDAEDIVNLERHIDRIVDHVVDTIIPDDGKFSGGGASSDYSSNGTGSDSGASVGSDAGSSVGADAGSSE